VDCGRVINPNTVRAQMQSAIVFGLTAALKGEPVDRVPIWLREGFPLSEPVAEADDFSNGWQADPLYRELYHDISPYVDDIRNWNAFGGWHNRFLMIPPKYIHTEVKQVNPDLIRHEGVVDTPHGPLTFANEHRRGYNTSWHVKALVESIDDLKKLASVPYSFDDEGFVEGALARYQVVNDEMGDRGVLRCGLSSPIVCISGCMKLETFLEFSLTEKAFFHELLKEITRRGEVLIDALFNHAKLDTTFNLGGSEQCTPPLMPPKAFDEYVVPYDGPLMDKVKAHGILTNCHCHGKISHALQCMVDMGIDSTDPVEPPPAGDVTFAQAREIADGRITLEGNFEFDELCFRDPDHIRARVREMLGDGTRRLILGASAGPLSRINKRLAANYRAWIDEALTYSS